MPVVSYCPGVRAHTCVVQHVRFLSPPGEGSHTAPVDRNAGTRYSAFSSDRHVSPCKAPLAPSRSVPQNGQHTRSGADESQPCQGRTERPL